jgi:pimeloyl-ACP methyl ester carboxylesterase
VSSNSEIARKLVLETDAQINAAGGDRTRVKIEAYRLLRAQGLDDEADLLMTWDSVSRANANHTPPAADSPAVPSAPRSPASPSFLSAPAAPSGRSFRNKKLLIVSAFLVAIAVAGALLIRRTISPVVVPVSHFVGGHGKNRKLIVFVHGVIGDMDNTWVNAKTHASWPEMFRSDDELSKFDVYVYGYASPATGNASTIEEIAVRFLQFLKDSGDFQNYGEVDFITHSMGGLITKRMLNKLNTPADVHLLQQVRTVIYISVPSNGADAAVVASWLSQNPQFKGMDPKAASDFLQGVEGDWANMLRNRNPSSPFPRTYSAYETLSTGPITVVPKLYTSELSDEPVIGFDYNHIDIVKPQDRDAEVYGWTKARILESANKADGTEGRKLDDEKESAHFELQGDEDAVQAIQAELRLVERKQSPSKSRDALRDQHWTYADNSWNKAKIVTSDSERVHRLLDKLDRSRRKTCTDASEGVAIFCEANPSDFDVLTMMGTTKRVRMK